MLSIIVPCYNEAENLPILVEKLQNLINSTSHTVEVILVNNGSTDASAEILERLLQGQKAISSILVPINKGYGNGLNQGFNAAQGDVLACTHADMQTDPMAIIVAYEKYLELTKNTSDKVLIKGRRINRPVVEQIFTTFMQIYTNLKLKTHLSDIGAQPKLFSKIFWDSIKNQAPSEFAWDIFVLYRMHKIGRIETIDVDYSLRQFGEAKMGSGSWKARINLCKRMFTTINNLAKSMNKDL
ncbi:MAG: glycosyltransferase family 2 protein [Brevinema sp.]